MNEQLVRIVADYALFLAFCDDSTLDPKLAVSMLEDLGAQLNRMSSTDREWFRRVMAEIAEAEELPQHAEFLRSL